MSLSEVDRIHLVNAIAGARYAIPLDTCMQVSVEGVCEVIGRIAKMRDDHQAQAIALVAENETLRWRLECSEKDVANEKRRLAEMTTYRDNATERLAWATRERDDARRAPLPSVTRPGPSCMYLADGTKIVLRRKAYRGTERVWMENVPQAVLRAASSEPNSTDKPDV